MSKRYQREVMSRLIVLIAHYLKWEFQPRRRTPSWIYTIRVQREELSDAFASKNLRSYADSVVENCYKRAKQDAAEETGLAESVFPETSPYTAAEWVALPVPELGDSA